MSDAADQANNNLMLGASLLGDVRETPQEQFHITEFDASLESEATYIRDVRALDKVDALHKVLPQGVKLGHRSLQITPDQIR